MRIPISVHIKSIFARDKNAFWWNHFTDEEKELKRMDAWQLAAVIQEANVRSGMEQKRIVAEHMLNVRLAQIQSKAAWGSGLLGFIGAIIGAALSVALTSVLQGQNEASRTPERKSKKQAVVTPVQEAREPITQPLKNEPSNKVIGVTFGKQAARP